MRGLAALAFMTALSFPAISPAVAGFLSPLLPGLPIVVEARLVCGKFAGKFSCKHIDDGTVGIEIGGDEEGAATTAMGTPSRTPPSSRAAQPVALLMTPRPEAEPIHPSMMGVQIPTRAAAPIPLRQRTTVHLTTKS